MRKVNKRYRTKATITLALKKSREDDGSSSTPSFIDKLAQGISVKEFSRVSKIPAKTVYDWMYRDCLPLDCVLRVNGRIKLVKKAVEDWLLSQQPAA